MLVSMPIQLMDGVRHVAQRMISGVVGLLARTCLDGRLHHQHLRYYEGRTRLAVSNIVYIGIGTILE